MSQEVIRDFLNVPGIEGFALIYGECQPIFYSKNPKFEVIQKDALFQGILQVVETIPTGFEVFEFRFSERQISLYRLLSGAVLLIVRDKTVIDETEKIQLQAFQTWLESDLAGAIAAISTLDLSPEFPTLKDFLNALNQLCDFTTQYLGAPVIVNYLKSSRPDVEWLHQFQIERFAKRNSEGISSTKSEGSPQIIFLGELSKTEQPLTEQELDCLRHWTTAFVRRCSLVVRDFDALIEQKALSDVQKALLFSP